MSIKPIIDIVRDSIFPQCFTTDFRLQSFSHNNESFGDGQVTYDCVGFFQLQIARERGTLFVRVKRDSDPVWIPLNEVMKDEPGFSQEFEKEEDAIRQAINYSIENRQSIQLKLQHFDTSKFRDVSRIYESWKSRERE